MTKTETFARLETCFDQDHKRRATRKTYRGWVNRYIAFLQSENPQGTSAEKVAAFLTLQAKKSQATQRQALNAIVYLYKRVFREDLGKLPAWTRSRAPRRLPTVLTSDECVALFRHMRGTPRLVAQMLFGSGLRLTECLELRTKDICLQTRTITIRGGKGDKSRATMLPAALVDPIRDQVERNRDLWTRDRAADLEGVEIPDGLQRKFPNAGKTFEWFYLFPAQSLCKQAGHRLRWRIHDHTVGKALATAARSCGIPKRVTAHTLRHSFATAALVNGCNIKELQTLLGHANIETTAIYLHVLPQFITRQESPLDTALARPATPADIIAFPALRSAA